MTFDLKAHERRLQTETRTLSEIECGLYHAAMEHCTCGGGGPDDPHTCSACRVWHTAMALLVDGSQPAEQPQRPAAGSLERDRGSL